MYWAAKIARILNFEKQAKLPAKFSGLDAEEQVKSVLASNLAIRGNADLTNEFWQAGEVVYFRKGETIIRQGETDNDVYFLLAGSVDVVFKRQLGSIRKAPNQIGEMAAISMGEPRSATVVASTDEVAALKVPGAGFHRIWKASSEFQASLQIEMNTRHVQRVQAGEVAKKNNSLFWFATSLGLAIVSGLTAWFFFAPQDWTEVARAALSAMVGLGLFVFSLLHNPAFFWRRCAGLVLLAMVGFFSIDQFVAFEASEGFGSLSIDIRSKGTDTEGAPDLVEMVGFVVVFIVCALMDRNQA